MPHDVPEPLEQQGLPAYAGMLAARHAAHAPELSAVVAGLPVPAGGAVLSVACGDGFFAGRFARGVAGVVVASDVSPALLAWARGREEPADLHPTAADAERLPFADAAFDLVWLGQSLMTLRGSVGALRECRRVLKPGGTLAVLENDKLHECRLPWPPELELAVHAALAKNAAERGGVDLGVTGVDRRVGSLLTGAGFAVVGRETVTSDRRGPLGPADRVFLESYLQDLGDAVRPHLGEEHRAAFDEAAAAGTPASVVDAPGTWMSWTDTLWTARPA